MIVSRRFWDIQNEGINEETLSYEKFLLFETVASFANNFTRGLIKEGLKHESSNLDSPTNSSEVYEFMNRYHKDKKNELKVGPLFGFPERITSFWDSMRIAFFLNSHGHYTQSFVLLRLALDTNLVAAIKWILAANPKRLDESERIKKMFENLEISEKDTKSDILDRIEKIGSYDHKINPRQAIRELVDYGILEDHEYWWRYLKIHKLNAHVHSKDEYTDRFNTSAIGDRQFSLEYMEDFLELSFAIIDLQLSTIWKLNNKFIQKNRFLEKPPKKEDKLNPFYSQSQKFLHYIPNFARMLHPEWVGLCIECKTRHLSKNSYVCGSCKKKRV